MRKALSGILTSLLFSASLVGLSSTGEADEYDRGDSSRQATDIQPHDRSDRDEMNPKTPSRAPEKVNPPKETLDKVKGWAALDDQQTQEFNTAYAAVTGG